MFAKRDLIFAFSLHVLIVGLLLMLSQWHVEHPTFPEHTIQVKMVSLKDLQAMMAKPEVKPVVKPKPAPPKKEPVKPKPKPKPIPPKAVLHPKPQTKQKAAEEELDYDPFAPLESEPKKRITEKRVSGEQALNDMLKNQLTDAEVNRYIAGMQQAVERQWKVPTEMLGKLKDALVELKLLHNGKVASVRILESTGSPQLDETLIQAIHAAAPFEIPTQQFALFKTNQIRFYPLK